MTNTETRAGRTVIQVIVAIVVLIVVIFILFYFLSFLGRLLGIGRPRPAPSPAVLGAAEQRDKLQITNEETRLVVEELPPGEDAGEKLDDVIASPSDYAGKKITVNGYIDRNVQGWGFRMIENKESHRDMLVVVLPQLVNENQLGEQPYRSGTPVSVEGTVKYLTKNDNVNAQTDIDGPFTSIYNRHVIVAEKVLKIE